VLMRVPEEKLLCLTYAKRTSANGANASERGREERVFQGALLCETEA